MARSRRRRTFSTPKRRRRRADWVYRPNAKVFGTDATGDQLGSYEGNIQTLTSGVSNAQTRILYDSTNYLGYMGRGGQTGMSGLAQSTVIAVPRVARAEGRKPAILAVEGILYVEASTWAIGNLIALGLRMGVFEQDLTGVIRLDGNYSMWTDETVVPRTKVAQWANNGRSNTWERRRHHFFSGDTPSAMIVPISWKGRRSLQGDECFALYLELESTSVNARTQCWLRTLVEDEG